MSNDQRHADHREITQTIETIGRGADARRWDEVRNAFAARVVFDYGTPELLLPDQIVDRWRPLLGAFDSTEHVVSDPVVEWVDADLARVKSHFRSTHRLLQAEGGDTWVLTGRYEHELVRTASGWKVSRMRMVPGESTGNGRLIDGARARANLPTPAPASFRVEHIRFESHGTQLVGVLRVPVQATPASRLPAVVVTGSWTTVKEQMPAAYAERLAAAGFAAFTFDFRGFGESVPATGDAKPSDLPRYFESPLRKVEDIHAAVDALSANPLVDFQRIGLLAVCASTGYAALESADDARVRSLVLVAPWLHDPELVRAIYGGESGVRERMNLGLAAEREYEDSRSISYVAAASGTDPSAAMGDFEYYLSPARGGIPQWGNRFALMSWPGWLTFDPSQAAAARVRAPTRFVHSETGAVPEGVRRFTQRMTAPHDVQWLDGPTQFDFYDDQRTIDRAIVLALEHLERTLVRSAAAK
ncbi:nuclear transport factor 2 family protein [Pendulispora rubella]|uniref:Nuclear transport factor 2 family protein n=1 Tax=Pendulispora rubella TaxID=2741070 RepID=A0ABZ2LDI1_9BACT